MAGQTSVSGSSARSKSARSIKERDGQVFNGPWTESREKRASRREKKAGRRRKRFSLFILLALKREGDISLSLSRLAE